MTRTLLYASLDTILMQLRLSPTPRKNIFIFPNMFPIQFSTRFFDTFRFMASSLANKLWKKEQNITLSYFVLILSKKFKMCNIIWILDDIAYYSRIDFELVLREYFENIYVTTKGKGHERCQSKLENESISLRNNYFSKKILGKFDLHYFSPNIGER